MINRVSNIVSTAWNFAKSHFLHCKISLALVTRREKKAKKQQRQQHMARVKEFTAMLAKIPWGNRRYTGSERLPKSQLPIPKELESDFYDLTC